MLCKILKGAMTMDVVQPDGSHGDVTFHTGDICDVPAALIIAHPEYCQPLTPDEVAAHRAAAQAPRVAPEPPRETPAPAPSGTRRRG